MKIIVGTTSKIKLRALEEVLEQFISIIKPVVECTLLPYEVESLVPDTPFAHETYRGAKNRAKALLDRHNSEGDLYVGLESGLLDREGQIFEECWCVILTLDGKEYKAYSSGLMLPEHVIEGMRAGKTHIEVLNELSKDFGGSSKDTWSLYSKGALSRVEGIKEAFRNALLTIERHA